MHQIISSMGPKTEEVETVLAHGKVSAYCNFCVSTKSIVILIADSKKKPKDEVINKRFFVLYLCQYQAMFMEILNMI